MKSVIEPFSTFLQYFDPREKVIHAQEIAVDACHSFLDNDLRKYSYLQLLNAA